LVAGIGNIFLGDDGFGVEVANRLATQPQPPGVRVADYGIRGMHLAYDLLAGYHATILVDAMPRGEAPGTVYVLDVGRAPHELSEQPVDAHGMQPQAVLTLLASLGGDPGHVFVVGCEPADLGERIGLSAPVAAAVDQAVQAVVDLVAEQLAAQTAIVERRCVK
jgi:hydrogenase maturation protease